MVVISTKLGRINGLSDGNVKIFRGIRYGKPPVGQHRFMPPLAASAWNETVDATVFPKQAMQPAASPILGRREASEMSEDCLFLNIFTPSTQAGQRPVLFWIHGGSLTTGSANDYDGSVLAEQGDVVVVAVNYRLGLFGFCDLSVLDDQLAGSACNGFRDQILALKWVRDHIADYGGDPDNVTIFGESAGGTSVSSLLAAPAADGLYHKAIVHSGSAANLPPLNHIPKLTTQLGVEKESLIKTLRGLSARELLASQVAMGMFGGSGIDGTVVTRSTPAAISEKGPSGVPLIAGTNHDEGTLFSVFNSDPELMGIIGEFLAMATLDGADPSPYLQALKENYPEDTPRDHYERIWTDRFRRPALQITEAAAKSGPGGWLYRFDLPSTIARGKLGATHSCEIPFTFNNFVKPEGIKTRFHDPKNPIVQKLAQLWSDTILRFARTGNPNGAGLPDWPHYTSSARHCMILDENSRIEKDVDRTHRKFWGDPT